MTKPMTMALAIAALLVAAAVAAAQIAPLNVLLTGTVSPSKGGSDRRPRHAEVEIAFTVNKESRKTIDRIELHLPRKVRLDGAGFRRCTAREVNAAGGTSGCPRGSRVGSGTAAAVVGPAETPVSFSLELHVASPRELTIFLRGEDTPLRGAVAVPITRAEAPYGQKVAIDLPSAAQRPLGAYAYLTSVRASIRGRTRSGRRGQRRTRSFAALRGCSGGVHRFGVDLRYVANDAGAGGRSGIVADEAACRG